MSIASLLFVSFVFIVLILYFVVPKKYQWIVLLISSIAFYVSFGVQYFLYVLFTATSVFLSTTWQNAISVKQKTYFKEHKTTLSREDKKIIRKHNKTKRKLLMIVTLLLNLGLLSIFKYSNFVIDQINNTVAVFSNSNHLVNNISLIAPLGISFYTFQSIGYMLDVYWEYYLPEKNYFKVLLFVCFFPQITQGPISSFESLSGELFTEHKFSSERFIYGGQRMIWGFFKKMVVADGIVAYVNSTFSNYQDYIGLACLLGMFAYSVQIYADFSGYMDIMCGLCEMLGVKLTENFNRPYFSKSVAEYWRRWHISLGDWFKKYIYYPMGMSSGSRNIAKKLQPKFGKNISTNVPATLALIVTWLATGLWHGASWAYIVWGLLNGLFIILSLWLDSVYKNTRKKFNLSDSNTVWRAFQVVRTFILITFIKVIPEVGTLSDGLNLVKRVFTEHTIPHSLWQCLPFVGEKLTFMAIAFGVILMFMLSLLQRKKPVRDYFNQLHMFVRVLCLTVLLIMIFIFGIHGNGNGGFMYGQF